MKRILLLGHLVQTSSGKAGLVLQTVVPLVDLIGDELQCETPLTEIRYLQNSVAMLLIASNLEA